MFQKFFYPNDKKRVIERRDIVSFFRVVDDIADEIPYPKNVKVLKKFISQYNSRLHHRPANPDVYTDVIKKYIALHKKYNFDDEWVACFFDTMLRDARGQGCNSLDELYLNLKGSSEFIGAIWCRFYSLDRKAEEYAGKFLRGLGIAEMIVDFVEDVKIKRLRLPLDNINYSDLPYQYAKDNPEGFRKFIRHYLSIANKNIQDSVEICNYLQYFARAVFLANVSLRKYQIQKIYDNPFIILNDGFSRYQKTSWKYRLYFSYHLIMNFIGLS